MKKKRAILGIVTALVLLTGAVQPSLAGKVTAINFTKAPSIVWYESWRFFMPYSMHLCVMPGETKWEDDVFGAIGRIQVYRLNPDYKCTKNSTYKDAVALDKDYTPTGEYMPHRKFLVVMESGGAFSIKEE